MANVKDLEHKEVYREMNCWGYRMCISVDDAEKLYHAQVASYVQPTKLAIMRSMLQANYMPKEARKILKVGRTPKPATGWVRDFVCTRQSWWK